MADELLQNRQKAPVLRDQIVQRPPGPHCLGQVGVFDRHLREVALEDAREVAGRVADRLEEHAVDVVELLDQAQLQRALDDGADEGLKARIGVRDLELVAAADDSQGQGAAGVDQLHRRVDGEATHDLAAGMGSLPGGGGLADGRTQGLTPLGETLVEAGSWRVRYLCHVSRRLLCTFYPTVGQYNIVVGLSRGWRQKGTGGPPRSRPTLPGRGGFCPRPFYSSSPRSASRMTRGVIGREVKLTPVASETAVQMAASGGTTHTSPTPRTP